MKIKNYKPLGARLLVDPIITTVGLEEHARLSGLEIVLEHDNVPRPTQGRVVAVGSDPLLQEEVKVGQIVFFKTHSGRDEVWLEGVRFLQLEHQDVTGVSDEEVTPSLRQDELNSTDQPSPEHTLGKPA